jgi:hypothetical protein
MSDLGKVLDELLKGAVTQEQRNEIWVALLEALKEVSDDEEWARFRKMLDEIIAKKSAN